MASIEQAAIYNKVRGNEDWEDIESEDQARALLEDAEDYIRATYNLRSDLNSEEQRLLDSMIYRIAASMLVSPLNTAAKAAVKKESVEGDLGKVETEYFETTTDPFPYVTTLLQSLVRKAGGAGLVIGRLVR